MFIAILDFATSPADRPRALDQLEGERPRHPGAPQFEGTGEIRLESVDRASGYWITRSATDPSLNARTSGVYLRAGEEMWRSWTAATRSAAPS